MWMRRVRVVVRRWSFCGMAVAVFGVGDGDGDFEGWMWIILWRIRGKGYK